MTAGRCLPPPVSEASFWLLPGTPIPGALSGDLLVCHSGQVLLPNPKTLGASALGFPGLAFIARQGVCLPAWLSCRVPKSWSGAQCPVPFPRVTAMKSCVKAGKCPPWPHQGGLMGRPGLRVRQAEAGNHEALSGSHGSFSVLVLLLWAFHFRS